MYSVKKSVVIALSLHQRGLHFKVNAVKCTQIQVFTCICKLQVVYINVLPYNCRSHFTYCATLGES